MNSDGWPELSGEERSPRRTVNELEVTGIRSILFDVLFEFSLCGAPLSGPYVITPFADAGGGQTFTYDATQRSCQFWN